MIEKTAIYVQIYDDVLSLSNKKKKGFHVEKIKLVWEASLRCHKFS